MDVKVTIRNMPQIRAAFNKAPFLMRKGFETAIKKATLLIEGRSKMRTPVLTGYLRSSHRTSFRNSGLSFEGTVEPLANYAMFVHEGTKFMRGRPFLAQAVEESEGTIQNIFERETQSVLDQIGRSV